MTVFTEIFLFRSPSSICLCPFWEEGAWERLPKWVQLDSEVFQILRICQHNLSPRAHVTLLARASSDSADPRPPRTLPSLVDVSSHWHELSSPTSFSEPTYSSLHLLESNPELVNFNHSCQVTETFRDTSLANYCVICSFQFSIICTF